MAKELPSDGSQSEKDAYMEQWANKLRAHGEQLRQVRDAAIQLAEKHPGKFTVTANKNEDITTVTATTDFEVQFEEGKVPLSLSVGVTSYRNGRVENEVSIRPKNGSYMDKDALSYRLDVVQGSDVDDEYKRLLGLQQEDGDMGQFTQGFIDGTYERSFGGMSSMHDNYAESTVNADGALYIIENAKKLHRPTTFGFVSGISLKDFQRMQKRNSKGRKNVGLLGS